MDEQTLKRLICEHGVMSDVVPDCAGRGYDIYQHPDELAAFLVRCLEQNVQTVLELGTWRGGFAAFVAQVLGWEVVTVDASPCPSLLDNLTNVIHVQSPTVLALKELPYLSYDLVFIDADHSYDAVKLDYEIYAPLANKLVALHDIVPRRPGCEGSAQLWREIAYTSNGSLRPNCEEIICTAFPIGVGLEYV
jgi:cephalosporin hydroxylase